MTTPEPVDPVAAEARARALADRKRHGPPPEELVALVNGALRESRQTRDDPAHSAEAGPSGTTHAHERG